MSSQPDDISHPAPNEPFALFGEWYAEAKRSEPNDPDAMALATADGSGHADVRMVLLKHFDQSGFVFYTNFESAKGTQLAANPHAAICFHWKSLRRQIRVEGDVLGLQSADVDRYFHSRSRASQVGAAVSQQSGPLASRQELEERVSSFTEQHPGEIPRPDYWRGYRLEPVEIEFWRDRPSRLHERVRFTRSRPESAWDKRLLYP